MTNSAPERVDTDRLILERPGARHVDALVALATDGRVAEHLGGAVDRPTAWRAVCSVIGHWELRGYGFYAVVERATGQTIGRLGFWYPEGWPAFEMGWALAHSHWGQGFAAEATRALLPIAFGTMDQARVVSLILPANTRSIAVAQRLGMHVDGHTRINDRFDVDIWAIERDAALAAAPSAQRSA